MFGLEGMVGSVQIVPPTQSANFGHWGEARNIFAHKKVATKRVLFGDVGEVS